MKKYVTIGLAGHIDHGKTSLTRALTNIETDRLKEEKERQISIENGFAYLDLDEERRVAIVDVPGHQKFIRQMIAGVAGIDLVLIVIAADEGVMPQTKEHLDILSILGIDNAFIIFTKVSLVDNEWLALVEEDVRSFLADTSFSEAPIYKVDSITMDGVESLKKAIFEACHKMEEKNPNEPFRLPIDDVFTLHGLGTVVRGTIFNGQVHKDQDITLLPGKKSVKVKSLQVHHQDQSQAFAGQRAAINIGGLSRDEVNRGDVLVANVDVYQPTARMDIHLDVLKDIDHPLKQRTAIVCHLGTAAVTGTLILFDRNRIEAGDSLYCQVQLETDIVAKKGDRVIIRRPSPTETIGGGVVIDSQAEKHRFGKESITLLEQKAKGSPEELVIQALQGKSVLKLEELLRATGLQKDILQRIITKGLENGLFVALDGGTVMLLKLLEEVEQLLIDGLETFHQEYPMRMGRSKAEWLKTVPASKDIQNKAFERLKEMNRIKLENHVAHLVGFEQHLPEKWAKRMTGIIEDLKKQGIETDPWPEFMNEQSIPEPLQKDFTHYLLETGQAVSLDDDHLLHMAVFQKSAQCLKDKTDESFTLQDAKEVLNLSRKYLIPFLECCDKRGWTKREDKLRKWKA